MSLLPPPPNAHAIADAEYGLAGHREFARRASGVLSGRWAQNVRRFEGLSVVMAYRAPTADDISRQPDLAKTEYGTLVFDDGGHLAVDLGDGAPPAMLDLTTDDPEGALAYVSEMLQQTLNRKVELKLTANKVLEKKRRRDSVPEAVTAMLSIYDDLLKQIEHEHYRQRDQLKARAYTAGRDR